MTEPESNPPSDRSESISDELRRERQRRQILEDEVQRLTDQVQSERTKLKRLTSRKSVRAATWAANLASPIVEKLRGLRRRPTSLDKPPTRQEAVTRAVCRHRPRSGPDRGPLVTIVILNRNGAHHLERLLPGLRDNTFYRSFELIVIDNGSSDRSIEILQRDWGFSVQTIRNKANVTFSRGCNQGLEAANGQYVLLLNNDISPISPGWLGALVEALENDPALGAAGSLLVYPERPGYQSKDSNTGADLTIQHRGIRFQWRRNAEPSATVPWAYNMGVGEDPSLAELAATNEVPAATAACLMVRTDLLRRLGGLDEGFTYGMEDVDLALRIRDLGYTVAVVGAAALFHHEFGTQSKLEAARRRSFGLSNLRHFSEKWGPRLSRDLDIEALGKGPLSLRGRDRSRIEFIAAEGSATERVAELKSGFLSAGFALGPAIETEDQPSVLVCLDPDFDVRKAHPDALTIAWIIDDAARWMNQPWFGSYGAYLAGSAGLAHSLAEAGAAAVSIAPRCGATEVMDLVSEALLRPRIGVNVSDRNDPFAANLAGCLAGFGANPTLRSSIEWDAPVAQCVDIVIHVRGAGTYEPRPTHRNVLLVVDDIESLGEADCAGYDLVISPTDGNTTAVEERIGKRIWIVPLADDGKAFDMSEMQAAIDSLAFQPDLSLSDSSWAVPNGAPEPETPPSDPESQPPQDRTNHSQADYTQQ